MINNRQEFEALFKKHGLKDYKWLDTREIVVSQWVRMKCKFGCESYGKKACCPPNTLSVSECREFFGEYSSGVIFHLEKIVDSEEDRLKWTNKINRKMLKLEKDVFLAGCHKALLMFMGTCRFCSECGSARGACKNPKTSRPTPEAMAIDVYSTVRRQGYPIEVLAEYTQAMNRYAFLLIE